VDRDPSTVTDDLVLPMTDLARISSSLAQGDTGIWVPIASRSGSKVSFPTQGHQECLAVEDQSFWFRHRNACLLQMLGRFPPGGAVFELGAGNGFVTSAFEGAGHECVALEPAVEGARNARLRGVRTVVCSTLESAAFQAGSLPAIGLFDVIEHIEHDGPFLTEVARVLSPGGRVYVTVPAYRWLWSDEDVEAGHFRRYALRRMRRDLESVGLSIEYATYFFSPLLLPVFLFRTLPSLLRRRSVAPASRAAAQHAPQSGFLTRILIEALGAELAWLRAGRRLPFGSSCLLVARKSEAEAQSRVGVSVR
jgi:SAM-dependent methyltransferase